MLRRSKGCRKREEGVKGVWVLVRGLAYGMGTGVGGISGYSSVG